MDRSSDSHHKLATWITPHPNRVHQFPAGHEVGGIGLRERLLRYLGVCPYSKSMAARLGAFQCSSVLFGSVRVTDSRSFRMACGWQNWSSTQRTRRAPSSKLPWCTSIHKLRNSSCQFVNWRTSRRSIPDWSCTCTCSARSCSCSSSGPRRCRRSTACPQRKLQDSRCNPRPPNASGACRSNDPGLDEPAPGCSVAAPDSCERRATASCPPNPTQQQLPPEERPPPPPLPATSSLLLLPPPPPTMMTLMGDRFLTSFPSITKTRSLQTCVSTQCVQASTADTPAKYLATLAHETTARDAPWFSVLSSLKLLLSLHWLISSSSAALSWAEQSWADLKWAEVTREVWTPDRWCGRERVSEWVSEGELSWGIETRAVKGVRVMDELGGSRAEQSPDQTTRGDPGTRERASELLRRLHFHRRMRELVGSIPASDWSLARSIDDLSMALARPFSASPRSRERASAQSMPRETASRVAPLDPTDWHLTTYLVQTTYLVLPSP